LRTNGISVFSR